MRTRTAGSHTADAAAAPPRRIAIVNQKGGVAKTTTAVSIAAAAAEAGHSVLLVDLDPQASATQWLQPTPNTDDTGRPLTTLQVLAETCTVDEAAVPCTAQGVELLPADADLLVVERHLSQQPGAEVILRAAIDDARPRDLVLYDCPPTLGLLAVSALCAAHEVLVPVGTRAMDVIGVRELVTTVRLVASRLNPGLAITGVLPTQVRSGTNLSRDVLAQLGEAFPDQLLPAIRQSVRICEAPSAHQPITAYDRTSGVAQDYRAVTTALLARGAPT